MFSSKDLQVKLVYMSFGGMIAIVGMLFGIGMLSSVTAQRDNFDTIQCRRLEVVDADGKVWVEIGATNEYGIGVGFVNVMAEEVGFTAVIGGSVTVMGKDGKSTAVLGINEHGGLVSATGKDGVSKAWLGIQEHGGVVVAAAKDAHSRAVLGAEESGGIVSVYDRYGKQMAWLRVNEYGGGIVSAIGKDGKSAAGIGNNEHGVFVSVQDGKLMVGLGINTALASEGIVFTKDQYGNAKILSQRYFTVVE